MTVSERKEENRAVDKLIRILTDKLERPEFAPGGVPVKVAAAVYGKAPCFIHEGIRAGWLPIGHCKPGEQKDNFYISPKKLWEDTGFIYTGQSVEEIEKWKKSVDEDERKAGDEHDPGFKRDCSMRNENTLHGGQRDRLHNLHRYQWKRRKQTM